MTSNLTQKHFVDKAYELAFNKDRAILRGNAIEFLQRQLRIIDDQFGPREHNFFEDDEDDDLVTTEIKKIKFIIDTIYNFSETDEANFLKAYELSTEMHNNSFYFLRQNAQSVDQKTAQSYYDDTMNSYMLTLLLHELCNGQY